jgi:diguanylate cyclase (GGDEF)-like protein
MGNVVVGMRDRLVIAVCLAVFATCGFVVFSQSQRERAHVEELFVVQTGLIASLATDALGTDDRAALGSLVAKLSGIRVLAGEQALPSALTILDASGRGLASSPALDHGDPRASKPARAALVEKVATMWSDSELVVSTAVYDQGQRVGFVLAAWDASSALSGARDATIRQGASAAVASLLVMLLMMVMLDRGVVAPLKRLEAHAHAVADLGRALPIDDPKLLSRRDEIGSLATVVNGMLARIAGASEQISDQAEEITRQNARFDAALRNMSQGLCMYDATGGLLLSNDRFFEIYGAPQSAFPEGMTYGEALTRLCSFGSLSKTHIDEIYSAHRAGFDGVGPSASTHYLESGKVVAVVETRMADGGWVATHEDISERVSAETQINHMALHDALTELPNRVLYKQNLETALARVERGDKIAVLCLDLDHFKSVNDTLGHPIGDKLLVAVAGRLRECVRHADTVARLGGDEFAIVQVGIEAEADAVHLANRVIERLAAPFEIAGHHVVIGTSVGLSFAPQDSASADELMKNADLALYRAKMDGRGAYRFFEKEMDARMQARRLMELDLRAALPRGEFMVYFQPLIDMDSNNVGGFEALLRWKHPLRGLVPPSDFIPLAEEIGLWVLREACATAVTWPDPLKVAVNLSPLQFKSKTLVEDIIKALVDCGLSPCRLELEITESVVLTQTEETLAILHRLRDLGIAIAMDDFGTGYSSLSYLQRFPFDRIKIDRSFVQDLEAKPNSIAIIKAITDLGVSLGIATTAEGVETSEQLESLRGSGCTVAQGYLFSQAIPKSEIAALIASIESRDKKAA